MVVQKGGYSHVADMTFPAVVADCRQPFHLHAQNGHRSVTPTHSQLQAHRTDLSGPSSVSKENQSQKTPTREECEEQRKASVTSRKLKQVRNDIVTSNKITLGRNSKKHGSYLKTHALKQDVLFKVRVALRSFRHIVSAPAAILASFCGRLICNKLQLQEHLAITLTMKTQLLHHRTKSFTAKRWLKSFQQNRLNYSLVLIKQRSEGRFKKLRILKLLLIWETVQIDWFWTAAFLLNTVLTDVVCVFSVSCEGAKLMILRETFLLSVYMLFFHLRHRTAKRISYVVSSGPDCKINLAGEHRCFHLPNPLPYEESHVWRCGAYYELMCTKRTSEKHGYQ